MRGSCVVVVARVGADVTHHRCDGRAGGRVTFKFEETVWRFQQMVIDHMVGKPRVWGGDNQQEFDWRSPDE